MQATTTSVFDAVKMGDKKAFEQLFKTHYESLVRFAIEFVKDQDAAEDLVQEVFVKIWERKENISITTGIKPYLFMSVKNHCLNKLKAEQRNAFLHDDYAEDNRFVTHHTDQSTDTIDLAQHIKLALEKLPPRCALIFKLSRFEDKSYKEIAESLELSVKTVEAQMGKALSIMRSQLSPYLKVVLIIFLVKFL